MSYCSKATTRGILEKQDIAIDAAAVFIKPVRLFAAADTNHPAGQLGVFKAGQLQAGLIIIDLKVHAGNAGIIAKADGDNDFLFPHGDCLADLERRSGNWRTFFPNRIQGHALIANIFLAGSVFDRRSSGIGCPAEEGVPFLCRDHIGQVHLLAVGFVLAWQTIILGFLIGDIRNPIGWRRIGIHIKVAALPVFTVYIAFIVEINDERSILITYCQL